IAEEQRKAEEERRRREQARIEAERKAEQARIAKEKAEREAAEKARREAAEKERLLAEQRAASKAAAKAAEEDQVRLAQAEREKNKQQTAATPTAKSATKSNKRKGAEATASPSKNQGSGNYADARKRAPRSNTYTTPAKETAPAKAAAAPAKKGDVASSGSLAAAKPAAAAGTNFANMRGSLPRPVSGSFRVTSRFGRQSLPDLPDVVYDNPGIDAETSSGAAALAVYQGKVSGVYMIPGYHTVVIVNHGNYYTVYGNISSPTVKVGDTVNAGHKLGSLAPDEDDRSHSSIHFEVWRNREKLNPLEWIR
ncbi:MAG: M23 family metallopeptidase, partial [Muribaculaceae bacterium]|nr:M23 family metallopeptidase [Muribaculaceae bacterium]